MKAVILAAGMGTRLEIVSKGIPKCMIKVGNLSLIERMIRRIAETEIDEIIVVTGHRANELRSHVREIVHPLAQDAIFVHNDRYAQMGNFYSLLVAEEANAGSSFVKIDGDVLVDKNVLPIVLAAKGPAALAVDCRDGLGEEEMKVRVDDVGTIVAINKTMAPKTCLGEYIGVDRIDAEICSDVFTQLRDLITRGETHEYYERAYELLMQEGITYEIADITGCMWTEIDNAEDLEHAQALIASKE